MKNDPYRTGRIEKDRKALKGWWRKEVH